jgi:nucleoid DNA-binding protein
MKSFISSPSLFDEMIFSNVFGQWVIESQNYKQMLAEVGRVLKKGGKVSLVGFGSWSVSSRAARDGRNPQTGKTIQIAAKKCC